MSFDHNVIRLEITDKKIMASLGEEGGNGRGWEVGVQSIALGMDLQWDPAV